MFTNHYLDVESIFKAHYSESNSTQSDLDNEYALPLFVLSQALLENPVRAFPGKVEQLEVLLDNDFRLTHVLVETEQVYKHITLAKSRWGSKYELFSCTHGARHSCESPRIERLALATDLKSIINAHYSLLVEMKVEAC